MSDLQHLAVPRDTGHIAGDRSARSVLYRCQPSITFQFRGVRLEQMVGQKH